MDEFRLKPVADKTGTPVSIRMHPGLEKRVRALVKAKKVTFTSIVEVCLAAHLPELEKPEEKKA